MTVGLSALNSTLEDLIDTHGMSAVLNELQVVCFAKAEHLEANWGDNTASKIWMETADRIERARHYAEQKLPG